MKINKFLIIGYSLSVFLISCTDNAKSSSNEETEGHTDQIVENVEKTETTTPVKKDISVRELKELKAQNPSIFLLDVRTPEEFQSGAIEGAINIDYLGDSFAESVDTLVKNKPVYVYCMSGGRSNKAADILIEKGFQDVYNLAGGYTVWSQH